MSFKNLDLFGQVTLILLFIIGRLINGADQLAAIALLSFALLQIISLITHAVIGKKSWKEAFLRKIHIIGTVIVILIMLAGMMQKPEDKYDMSGLSTVIFALIPAILLALFYTVITYLEWRRIKVQKLVHLKR